jgi:hypothetical protein
MALIGIEYIEHFAKARASGTFDGGEDLSCPYYIATWFAYNLQQAGHTVKFLLIDDSVTERHMRDHSLGGDDGQFADSVDLYMIITHGAYKNNECLLLYDTNIDNWFGQSKQWRFGDNCNMEWLMIYGCQTIDLNHVTDHLHIFQRLHIFCGAYSYMYDSWTTDDVGNDTANDLISGKLVADSWGDGVSDWWAKNHPIALSVELQATWNGGSPDWNATVIGSDHLWGHGTTNPDIQPKDIYWMAAWWWDTGIYDG